MDNNETRPGERLVEGKPEAVVENHQLQAQPLQSEAQILHGIASLTTHAEQTELNALDRLTLHEERARVDIVKESAGAVTVRKLLKERTETIPVTLVSEVLEIVVNHSGKGKVLLDGQPLEVGRTYEVLLQDEKAVIQKEVYPVADINLRKQAHTVTHTEEVTLRREELDVSGSTELVHTEIIENGKFKE